jgi:hypothetical protein
MRARSICMAVYDDQAIEVVIRPGRDLPELRARAIAESERALTELDFGKQAHARVLRHVPRLGAYAQWDQQHGK